MRYLAKTAGLLIDYHLIIEDRNHITVKQTVKLANGKVIVGPPKTKNSTRRVAVTDDVISALMTHKAKAATSHPGGVFFSTRLGTPIDPRNHAHIL